MEQDTTIRGISYKINEHNSYKIKARQWNNKTFYNVALKQKQYDGTVEYFDRQLTFANCEPPEDGDYIKIISGFESNYKNPRDKYNWVTSIVVTAYEKVEPPEQVVQAAYQEYNQKASENAEDIVITGDDLPF